MAPTPPIDPIDPMDRPPDHRQEADPAPFARSARRLVSASYVIAWLSIIVYPVLLGPVAILLAVLGARRGDERRGRRAAVVAASCMVAGFALYAVVLPLAERNAPQSAADEASTVLALPTGPRPASTAAATPMAPTAPAATASASTAAGPAGSEPATLEPSPPFDRTVLHLLPPATDGSGESQAVAVPAYVAADPSARGRGLMHREDLPEGTGMVFLFPRAQRGGFYMKNTLLPLSIAFYGSDGRVLQIIDMEPCTADPCAIYTPEQPYVGALEVAQGWFDALGIAPGWSVELPDGLPTPT